MSPALVREGFLHRDSATALPGCAASHRGTPGLPGTPGAAGQGKVGCVGRGTGRRQEPATLLHRGGEQQGQQGGAGWKGMRVSAPRC